MTTTEAVLTIAAGEHPISVQSPPLNEGEKLIRVIASTDSAWRYALILLPGEAEPNTWDTQMAWADERGGELPDRFESALLYTLVGGEFKPEWYWTRDHDAEHANNAWLHGFSSNYESCHHKNYEARARAVRRLFIQ